jgi:hypothetical protein
VDQGAPDGGAPDAEGVLRSGGVEISDQGIGAEFADRPEFPLDAQLANMHRLPGKSKLDTWLNNIGEFMNAVGTIPSFPRPSPISTTPTWRGLRHEPLLKAAATNAN